ncbi:hypothetical protein PVMG_05599 [Plasmodium vivax Mauritania I]|uniref:Uncharacterized protein n=1 Tax=Plasmodium vivax Mauritania I TaxID=1035515 RepID=A0A0J9TJY2_PLAVI|nr:hypothetical protein PVMG_05599 [Plasmodium vivax Mauritania I]
MLIDPFQLQYFTYQVYNAVKSSFEYKPEKKIDISFVNEIIRRIHNTPEKELQLYKTFFQLKKLVDRHHSFLVYYREKCCNYINYWLNKTVRDSEYGVNEQNFKIFEDFKKADPKDETDMFDCIPKLRYMDNGAFQKMKNLYDLYDEFTILKQKKNNSSLCQNITDLAEKYNRIMHAYKWKDKNLFKELTSLKKVIEKDELGAKNRCGSDIFDLFLLVSDPPHGEEQNTETAKAHGRISAETSTTTHVSSSSSHEQGLGIQAEGNRERSSSRTPERSVPGQSERSPPGKPGLSESSGTRPGILGQPGTLGKPGLLEQPGPSVPRLAPELQGHLQVQQQGLLQEQQQVQRLEHIQRHLPERPEQPQEQARHLHALEDELHFSEDEEVTSLEKGDPSTDSIFSTFDTEKIMETIKGAVSDVLESVEPVPVLCVSGGMGALYLLFKVSKIALKLFKLHFYNYNTYK